MNREDIVQESPCSKFLSFKFSPDNMDKDQPAGVKGLRSDGTMIQLFGSKIQRNLEE